MVELKKRYCGFSKAIVQAYVNLCRECQLKKGNKSLKGQVDLIDFQPADQVNQPYNYLLVYKDHHTKFVVLRPLKKKCAEEVYRILLIDII